MSEAVTFLCSEDKSDTVIENDNFLMPKCINPSRLKKKEQTNVDIEDFKEDQILKTEIETNTVQKISLSKAPIQIGLLAEKSIPIPYKEPPWSGILSGKYEFDIMKNGVIIGQVHIEKPFLVVGRLASCDIILEHPSISRFHCIVQQRVDPDGVNSGLYIYDLGSTHGTFLNKYRVNPKQYNRIRVGHMIKFGGSSRTFIVIGPNEDQEPETAETVTELIALAKDRKERLKNLDEGEIDKRQQILHKETQKNESEKKTPDDGINWGMGEDAKNEEADDDEEDDYENNPYQSTTNEELYLDDPKNTLRGWFEREGHNLPEYQIEEEKSGVFRCKLELPVPGRGGAPLVCMVEHKGKKKDTVLQCALEACRILNRKNLLRQSMHESLARKRKDWSENDYYDSDEDDYLDRTGDIERKRKLRKKELMSAKSTIGNIETYDSSICQYNEVIEKLELLEKKLVEVDEMKKQMKSVNSEFYLFEEDDELDTYMSSLESQNLQLPDKHKRTEWKLEAERLRKEELKLRKIVNVTRPLGVSELVPRKSQYFDSSETFSRESPHLNKSKVVPKFPVSLSITRIHRAFMEIDEETKPKLCKIDYNDESDNVKPIPYAKTQPKLSRYSKYKELQSRRSKILLEANLKLTSNVIQGPSSRESESSNSKEINISCPIEMPECIQKSDESHPSGLKQHSSLEISENMNLPEERNVKCNTIDATNKDENGNNPSQECSSFRVEDEGNNSTTTVPDEPISPLTVEQLDSTEEPELKFVKPTTTAQALKSTRKKKENSKKSIFDFEKDYDDWVPPTGQSGDGRTSLNNKFGY